MPANEAKKASHGKGRKILIVGSAQTTLEKTPWDDESFEVWGLAWRDKLKRCDRRFDMHPIDNTRKRVPEDYIEWLNQQPQPVYVQSDVDGLKRGVVYPLDAVVMFLQGNCPYTNGAYFASSIAYMIGLALYEGATEIHLYGVDLLDEDEWSYQRPNTEYLLGMARGMGVRVFVAEGSALLRFTHLYGYEQPPDDGVINMGLLDARCKQYKQKLEDTLMAARTLDGAIQEVEQLQRMLRYRDRGLPIDAPTPTP